MPIDINNIVDDWVASPPETYIKFKKAIDNLESSFKDFSNIIHNDPALTARLLKIVNSPFYGYSSKIETIEHAMTIVGIGQLNELVLATTVVESFKGIPKSLVNMEKFWEHSIACGLVAQDIARASGEKELERFYILGMLHDIGSLVLFKKIPDKAKLILEKCESEKRQSYEVEKEVLGLTHADVGGALLKAWNLPPRVVANVTCHHEPGKTQKFIVEKSIIHLADIITRGMSFGMAGEQTVPSWDSKLLKTIELSEDEIPTIKLHLEEKLNEAMSVFFGGT